MNAKEYLEQIYDIDLLIARKKKELECLEETAGGSAAIRYDKINVMISFAGDYLERSIIKLMEVKDDIIILELRSKSMKQNAMEIIQRMDNENDRMILIEHYLNGKSFRNIAESHDKDIRWLKRVNNRAIESFNILYSVDVPPLDGV